MTSSDDAAGRARRIASRLAVVLAVAFAGGVIGFVCGLATPAHAEVAGSDVSLQIVAGQHYDELDLGSALVGKRASSRSALGEAVGVHATVTLDASYLFRADGSFNVDVLPVYLQAFSDPAQLVADLRSAMVGHLVRCAVTGAVAGAALTAAGQLYLRWRRGYDRTISPGARRTARTYRAPERRFARRLVLALAVVAVLDAVPGAVYAQPDVEVISPDPILADTPLAGTELSGLLRPAIAAVESYVRKYFAETDRYYGDLETQLQQYLAANPVTLPGGPGMVQFGFVTDRHCNVGMDRVVVGLLRHFDVTTLVSAGDDDFSGSFPFESACTSNLAEKSRRAGITEVAAAGNHDSAQTLDDERAQRIRVLDDKVLTVHGLNFLGEPDPRSSRYGQGIQPPSNAAQRALLDAQARHIGGIACAQHRPVIVVLHDPYAGRAALDAGCGSAVLALDGHTHVQAGPDPVPLPDGTTGSQFVGGSSGGAPNEHSIERSFASALTVGPLQHDATVNIVSFDTVTGRLAGVTVFRFTPDRQISVAQLTG